MSSLPTWVPSSPEEAEFNATNEAKQRISILTSCLDALMYQDGERKPLTHNRIKLIEGAKVMLNEADSLCLEAACRWGSDPTLFKSLMEAGEMGCEHPALYYFLGECYSHGDRGIFVDITMAFEYYIKAIRGMLAAIAL